VLYIKAGAAKIAGAWFIHWPVRPVRGLYRPALNPTNRNLQLPVATLLLVEMFN